MPSAINSENSVSINSKEIPENKNQIKQIDIDVADDKIFRKQHSYQYQEEIYEISNDLIVLKLSNYGASIKEVVLKEYYTHESLP